MGAEKIEPTVTNATREPKACRSHYKDGEACIKPRGHKSGLSRDHKGASGSEWTGGVKSPAFTITHDDGYMSEGDYQSWGRL